MHKNTVCDSFNYLLVLFYLQFERHGPPVVGPNPLPELTHVGLALESCSFLNEDFFAYAVLNSYMGGGGSFSAGGPGKGMYTHIYQNVLSQHHWVYWAMAQNHAYSDSGLFCLLGSAHPSKASVAIITVDLVIFMDLFYSPQPNVTLSVVSRDSIP